MKLPQRLYEDLLEDYALQLEQRYHHDRQHLLKLLNKLTQWQFQNGRISK